MRILGRVFASLLMVALLLGFIGCSSSENDVSNEVADDVSEMFYEWDGNIIIALTEEGLEQESLVIPSRCEGIDSMVFAESCVKSISFESDKDVEFNGTFGACETLENIELPAELTVISDMEFWLCSALEEITIPSGVISIGEYAFQDNTSLKKVNIEGDLTVIKQHAFEECSVLESINLPDTITEIGEYAFYKCDSLALVDLPASLSIVGKYAFADGGLSTLNVPSDMILTDYATTSFTQTDRRVEAVVTAGSWIDENFDLVFDEAFIKKIN